MNRALIILMLISISVGINAQTAESVSVTKDARIDLLVNKQIEINEFTTRNSRRTGQGFRVLVISTNDRNKVIEAKTKMYREFPELKAYMMYQAPFFRLKVGNFKERIEAEDYLSKIQRIYDKGVYIVPDVIEVRPEQDTQ